MDTKNIDVLSDNITNIADNFDDLLEALSIMRRLIDIPAYKLTEDTLLKDALKILYQEGKTTSSTIYWWSKNSDQNHLANINRQNILAVDANGIVHQRMATPVEKFFIDKTITTKTGHYCADCHSLIDSCVCGDLEKSITSFPIYDTGILTGVITINHSAREHTNQWWQQLMQAFSTSLGQQLTICRQQYQEALSNH